MDPSTSDLQATWAVEFALAAAGPLSLDQLVEWELVRPTDLWHCLQSAVQGGWVIEDGGAGRFAFRDEERRGAIIAAADADEWRSICARASIPRILENAREAARRGRMETASRIYRCLVLFADREAFPGGTPGWLEVVVEAVRAFRALDWLDTAVLDQALAIAVAQGDLRLQAVLSAACGFAAGCAERLDESRAYMERALEASQASGDRGTEFQVDVRIAYLHSIQGRPHECIAAFERFLGDLPEELVPLPPEVASPLDPLPETPLAILAVMLDQVGQHGRALELLNRMLRAGTRLNRPELVGLAHSSFAVIHASRRELEPARAHAEPAFEYFFHSGTEPYFLWRTAYSLAWVRMAEGRMDEARAVLDAGQAARRASGLAHFTGSALFEVLDRLDLEGVPPLEGLGIESEIDYMLSRPDDYMPGVAHRFRARRLARGDVDEERAREIDRLHARGIEMLRRSQACPLELARSLEDAGQWAARRGRVEEAAKLELDARRIYASLDLGAPEAARDASIGTALAELGRLATLPERIEGGWGELTARLCGLLGAEKCALVVERGGAVRTVAARGGGKDWVAAVESVVLSCRPEVPAELPPPATDEEPESSGRILIIPYESARLSSRGWAVLENRYSRSMIGMSDERVVNALSAQLGVILENLTLWQELNAARQRLEQENRYYRQSSPAPARSDRIVGDSPALRRTLELVARVAPATTSVLILGETGVGKELIANEIHRLSPRSEGPFIVVHIASLAPGLVTSGLFGHERGAFTGATEQTRGRFELANGGTLFLDEIGELGPDDQVRILRVLQEGTFERVGGTRPLRSDFRLVAATNRDLAAEVKAGRFREDLYFRLAAFPIEVPPLRARTEEIPTLALYFMENTNRKLGLKFEGIGEADMARLVAYRWPGNVRELEHVIERAALLSEPPRLRIPPLRDAFESENAVDDAGAGWVTLEEAERRYLRKVIQHTGGRITGAGGAAEILDVKASTLNWRIGKLGLRAELLRARAERLS